MGVVFLNVQHVVESFKMTHPQHMSGMVPFLKLPFPSIHILDFYTYCFEMKQYAYCLRRRFFLGKRHEKALSYVILEMF